MAAIADCRIEIADFKTLLDWQRTSIRNLKSAIYNHSMVTTLVRMTGWFRHGDAQEHL